MRTTSAGWFQFEPLFLAPFALWLSWDLIHWPAALRTTAEYKGNQQSERDKAEGPIEGGRRPEEAAAEEVADPTRGAACGHAGD